MTNEAHPAEGIATHEHQFRGAGRQLSDVTLTRNDRRESDLASAGNRAGKDRGEGEQPAAGSGTFFGSGVFCDQAMKQSRRIRRLVIL